MAVIGNAPFQGLVSGGEILDASIEGVDLSTSAIAARLGYTPVNPGAAAITAGSINNTTIGATTAAAATVSTLVATGQTSLGGTAGAEGLRVATTASAVNYVSVTGSTTGNSPVIATAGTDTDIDLILSPKGTGRVGIGTTTPAVKLEISGTTTNTWAVAGTISGTTLTFSTTPVGAAAGDLIWGIGIQPYTRLIGGGGIAWTVSVSQTVPAGTIISGTPLYGSTLIRIEETDTSVAASQPQGGLQFYGSDSSSPSAGVGAYVAAMAEANTPDTGLAFGTRDNGGGGIDANERMRLTSVGNLGIGTVFPGSRLHVAAPGATVSNFQMISAITTDSAASDLGGGISLGGYYTGTSSYAVFGSITGRKENATSGNYAGYLQFATGSQALGVREVMRLDSNGNVIVGDITPITGSASYIPPLQVSTGNTNNSGVGVNAFSSGSGSGYLHFNRSKSSTVGTNTLVTSGETLGNIVFAGADGTGFIRAATIQSIVDGTPGTNDMPGRLVFGTTADGASSPTERMRISSTGQTTISGNTIISVTDNTNAALRITQLGTGNALLVEDTTNPDSTPFVIDASGNTVVGSTAPIATVSFAGGAITPLLQVQGTGLNSSSAGVSNWSGTAASASSFVFSKSNSGTIGTRGAVASATNLGSVNFAGDDGTNFITAASILAVVDGTPGTNDMPGRLVFNTTADGASTPTERMRIDSSGNLGVGTTAPATKLHVFQRSDAGAAPNTPEIRIEHQDINALGTSGSNGGVLSFVNIQQNNTGWAADRIWGRINFSPSQPTSGVAQLGASILAAADGAIGGQQSTTYLAFYTSDATNGGNNVERLRIGGAGDIVFGGSQAGINRNFYFDGALNKAARIIFREAGTERWLIGHGAASENANFEIYSSTGNNYTFTRAGTFSVPASLRVMTTTAGNIGGIAASYAGSASYPTLFSDAADRWFMHINPHIAYTQNGVNGFTGSMTGSTIRMSSDTSSSNYWDVGVGTNSVGTDKFSIGRGGASKLLVDSTGNVLINTTGNIFGSRLAVVGAYPQVAGSFETNNSTYAAISCYASQGNYPADQIAFYAQVSSAATFAGKITCTTSTVSYGSGSDYRLKNSITPMTGALAKVALLNPVAFKWNVDGSDGQGFIAHELQTVIPIAVSGDKDEIDENGKPRYQTVDTSFLVATLTAAIQEQQALITQLTARLDAANL